MPRAFTLMLALAAGCTSRVDPVTQLDAQGRAMLAPMRTEALRPEALVDRLGLAPTSVVADIGAGPGFLTTVLARAVPSGRVIATDVRADYLRAAVARARQAGLTNVEPRVVTPDRPGLDERSVDLALLCQVDHALVDRAAYFAALAKALRPGGRIALVNYVRYRAADEAAAKTAHLRLVQAWTPSPPFFLLVLEPEAS